ncbi:MAG TPA: hypothetical protein VGX03_13950 [Candidatus Binatia bacterium]|nr:hypothetical protein [Candidatus Binatia bacterium]
MADHQPPPQSGGQSGETGWSLALKSIFWLIIVPAAVMLLVKWFLQP